MLQPAFQFHPIFEAPFFNPSYTEAVRDEREIRMQEGLARIVKLLRSPRIDSKEPIPPGCVAWRTCDNPIPTRFLAPIDCLTLPALDFAERDKCKPVLPRLSLVGNIEKPRFEILIVASDSE